MTNVEKTCFFKTLKKNKHFLLKRNKTFFRNSVYTVRLKALKIYAFTDLKTNNVGIRRMHRQKNGIIIQEVGPIIKILSKALYVGYLPTYR